MKIISDYTPEVEQIALKNVKGFDMTKLNYKEVFNQMNKGLLEQVFDTVTTYTVEGSSQIKFVSVKSGLVMEDDGQIYPCVDMVIELYSTIGFSSKFCLTLTPFNANLDNENKTAGVYGGCDKLIRSKWRSIMKVFFKDTYEVVRNQYIEDVYLLRDAAIRTKAEEDLRRNRQDYLDEINSL